MTTDTVPKQVVVRRRRWIIGGMAKGAAMLAPNMATMLAVLTTDAAVEPDALQQLLGDAVAQVVQPHRRRRLHEHERHRPRARQRCRRRRPTTTRSRPALERGVPVARDADGPRRRRTHQGRHDRRSTRPRPTDEAERAARKLAGSLLVKSSFYGSDPYWGRVLSELGVAGHRDGHRHASPSRTTTSSCRRAWRRRAPTRRPSRRSPSSRSRASSAPARTGTTCTPTTSRTRTSTRTWGRRDRRCPTFDAAARGGDPRRSAAVHPALPGRDRRREVRRQRDDRRQPRPPVRRGRRADALRRPAAGRRPRRRSADQRAHGAARAWCPSSATGCG